MARIRTVKPDFFRHEALFEAERAAGLPLRLGFAGLWTVADREGRFRWRPRALKLDAMPYDDVDFGAVLDALHSAGFLVRYRVNGDDLGAIPSWSRHQVINKREAASSLPGPDTGETVPPPGNAPVRDGARTCNAPALNCGEVEGKGREGKRNTTTTGRAESLPKNGGRQKAAPVAVASLPPWLPMDQWTAFVAHRNAIRKPITPNAGRILIGKLDFFRTHGMDPAAILEQSVGNGWTGLFPLKDEKRVGRGPTDDPVAQSLAWVTSERGTIAKGRELGIEARPGEPMDAFRDRVIRANAERARGAA